MHFPFWSRRPLAVSPPGDDECARRAAALASPLRRLPLARREWSAFAGNCDRRAAHWFSGAWAWMARRSPPQWRPRLEQMPAHAVETLALVQGMFMRFIVAASLLSLSVLLSGCQSLMPGGASQSLPTTRQAWEHRPAGCMEKDCPLVNIDLQQLEGMPELNARIERELLKLTIELPGDPPPPSLAMHEREFLANGQPGWMSYLQTKVLDQHDRLVVIELSSYRFNGGKRGVPGRAYLSYDRELGRVVGLDDLLLPGLQDAFWEKARQAHQDWLKSNGLADNPEFQAVWPFVRTANVAPLRDAVMLKYEIERIAPYESGHPTLYIPYAKLKGVLKPVYFPGGR